MAPLSNRTLLVAWQEPKSRVIAPVGRLEQHPGGYLFEYIGGALDARARGFFGFFEFPQLAARYVSETLFPLFQNRLMPTARPDYREFIGSLGLDPASADPMGVLARSGGGRATDRVELFAPPTYDRERSLWETFFLLRGVRHRPPAAQARVLALRPGERLFAMIDLQNEHNPKALLLRSDDGHNLGYLPDYMVEDVNLLVERPGSLEILVEQVNPPPISVHHRVLCRLVAHWAGDFRPFASSLYRSLVDDPQARLADAEAAAAAE